MHLADGLLPFGPGVAAATLLGLAGVMGALAKVRRRRLGAGWASAGTHAAFILVAQAVNLPILPGASAHLVGTALLTYELGPAGAILTMATVLLIQALTLGDGGLTVLGVNTLTLAVLPALAAWACPPRLLGRRSLGVIAGTLLGHLLGAAALASLLVVVGGAPWQSSFAWLVGVQGLSGLIEGALTAALRAKLARPHPPSPTLAAAPAPAPLDGGSPRPPAGTGHRWALLALVLALLALPFASSRPDALEALLEQAGWAR